MTEEQIKSLKAGDKFTIEYYVYRKTNNGHFLIHYSNGDSYGAPTYSWEGFTHANLVTPPPTFEAGDMVRIVPDPLTGTIYGNGVSKDEFAGKENKVLEKANEWGNVRVKTHFGSVLINVHCLEMVKKAVKDKYCAREYEEAWVVEPACRDEGEAVSAFYKKQHPNAKAAAMAECARLNKGWRRQQEAAAVCDSGVTKGGAE